MPRIASLYLPNLPIDGFRRTEGKRFARPEPSAALPLPTLPARKEPEIGDRIEDCSCPRGGHWRPRARWAKEELQARIDGLPAHQRPSMREVGRRSEPAANPFRKKLGEAPRSSRAKSRGAGTMEEKRPSTSLGTNGFLAPLVTVHRDANRIVLAAVSPE